MVGLQRKKSDQSNKPRLSNVGFVTLLYLLLTVVMTWPMVPRFAQAIPGDGFDGWQNYWNLWWVKVALVDRLQNPFQTDLLYAPTGVDLYFHTLNPFNGLVTLPVQLSSGLLQAYNTVVLISWALGGLGIYLLTRWLLRSLPTQTPLAKHFPPFVAGLIFTFAPVHMAHLLGHMQVMSLQWIPFYILCLMRSLDQRRNGLPWRRNALLGGFFLVLCGLCDWYFVLYLFFFTGILIGWHLLADLVRTRQLFRAFSTWVIPPIWAGVFFFLILSPLLIPMIETASQLSFMVRPESDFYILSASLADFLIPTRLHTLFRDGSFGWWGNQIAPVSERTIGIGYIALLLGVLGIGLDRKRAGFWLGTALFFGAMALGPVIHLGNITWANIPADPALKLPESLASQLAPAGSINGQRSLFGFLNQVVPFMEISRSVSRYAIMVQLAVSVLAGIGLANLMGRWHQALSRRTSPAALAIFILPLLVLFEYWVAPFPMSPPDTPAAYSEASYFGAEASSLLNLPMNFDRPGYLLYQTVHEQPLAIAYISRDDPRTFTERVPTLQHLRHLGPDILADDPVAVGLTIFHDLGIETVVLDRYKMPGGLERDYTSALAEGIFEGETPLFVDDRITIYGVPPLEERMPYLALGPLNWGPLRSENGLLARSILGGPAQLWIYPGGSNSEANANLENGALEIHYQTSGNEPTLLRGAPDMSVTLPPSTDGVASLTVPLSDLLSTQQLAPETAIGLDAQPLIFEFVADLSQTVRVEQIRLVAE